MFDQRKMRRLVALLVSVVVLVWGAGLAAAASVSLYNGQPAKYVFFLVGDGMSQPQRTATEMFLAAREGKPHGSVKMAMSQFPAHGIMTNFSANSIIPDSADAVTAMACGLKTNSGMLGVNPEGKPIRNMAEMAKEKGMKIGIISTVAIDDATPGGFYTHQIQRSNFYEIGCDLSASGFDFFGGGGFRDAEGKRAKEKPAATVFDLAKKRGYAVVNNKADFKNLTSASGKAIVVNEWLQNNAAMPYAMDRTSKDLSLPELLAKAVEMLDNPQGFFIMTEAGKVDWALHANDAAAAIGDIIELDQTVQVALAFAEKHPGETLIVVTGDHETGGLTVGFAGTQYNSYFDVLPRQTMSFTRFTDEVVVKYRKTKASGHELDDLKPAIEQNFGLKFSGDAKDRMVLAPHEIIHIQEAFKRSMASENEKTNDPVTFNLYGGFDPLTIALTHILDQKAGLGWTTYAHTGLPITVSAFGVGAETFFGLFDNTDLSAKMKAIMGLPTEPRLAADK